MEGGSPDRAINEAPWGSPTAYGGGGTETLLYRVSQLESPMFCEPPLLRGSVELISNSSCLCVLSAFCSSKSLSSQLKAALNSWLGGGEE